MPVRAHADCPVMSALQGGSYGGQQERFSPRILEAFLRSRRAVRSIDAERLFCGRLDPSSTDRAVPAGVASLRRDLAGPQRIRSVDESVYLGMEGGSAAPPGVPS